MAKRREISWGASVKTKSAFSSDNALFYFHFYGSGMVVFWPTLSVCDITGQNIRHIVPILYNTEQKTIEKEVNQIRLVLTTLTSGLIHMLMWLQKSLTHKQMQVGSICWMKLHKTNLPGFFFFCFYSAFWVSVNESCDDGVWTHSESCERAGSVSHTAWLLFCSSARHPYVGFTTSELSSCLKCLIFFLDGTSEYILNRICL